MIFLKMIKSKKILGLVIARAGSKGLANKNIKKFKGKPLVQWTLDAAKKSKLLDHVIVSTDSKKIINIAKKLKIDVPFTRPKKISTAKTEVNYVISHALNWLKKNRGKKYDYLMLLQATSPHRNHFHIDSSIKYYFKISKNKFDTLVSVSEAPEKTCWIMYKKEKFAQFVFNKRVNRRQESPKFIIPNGAIYFCNLKKFSGDFYGNKIIYYSMGKKESLDIDSLQDFKNGLNQ